MAIRADVEADAEAAALAAQDARRGQPCGIGFLQKVIFAVTLAFYRRPQDEA